MRLPVSSRLRAAMDAAVACDELPPWAKRAERSLRAEEKRAAMHDLTDAERAAVADLLAQRMVDRALGRRVTAVPAAEVSL